MVIGIDGNGGNVDEQVGVSVYTLELLKYFKSKSSKKLEFIVYLRENPKQIMPSESDFFKYEIVKGKTLWLQLYLPIHLISHRKPDVFFSPAHFVPRIGKFKSVVTIHDLSYFYYPNEFLKKDLYKLSRWSKYSVKKAQKVIAVSENTKKDLVKFYDVNPQKITVIYNGFEKVIKKSKKIDIKKPYMLYVGTLQPRKNIGLLISAFDEFVKKHPSFNLVITGKKGWLYEDIFDQVKKLEHKNKIQFTGYVSDEELVYLYQNAFCFVLPSLYEGFGIPVLEAMNYGCPVISSNSSSLPEVGGDACLYFNPEKENELLEQLNLLVNDKQLRQELVKKGKERVKLFSWQKSAVETLKVLKTVAHDN